MAMFLNIVNELQKKTPLTITSFTNIRNKSLRKCVLEELSKKTSFEDNPLFAEPFFEAMFPWEKHCVTLATQVEKGEVKPVIQKLHANDNGEEYESLYAHQAKALAAIRKNHSIVVTTGTGSGKTECFLYPIFDYLARKYEESGSRPDAVEGVQALFLYPLNALIESQSDRFTSFCERFNSFYTKQGNDCSKLIRFANYTGKMGENPGEAADHRHLDTTIDQVSQGVEIQDRQTMRSTPPQLLITNATMLEYALIRKKDQTLYEIPDNNGGYKKTLKFVVLDEAHNYTGSNAAELKMRLKRVLEAFHCKLDDVLFIATSATAGSADDIRKFLASVTEVDENMIDVIGGHRDLPPIKEQKGFRPSAALEEMRKNPEDAQKNFDILEHTPSACKLRDKFGFHSGKKDFSRQTLSEIQRFLSLDSQAETLAFLDFASLAKKDDGFFLPLKMHLFQKEFSGIWACCNPECKCKQDSLKNEYWKFGKVYFEKDLKSQKVELEGKIYDAYLCDCGHSIYQLVSCRNCGQLHLAAKFEGDEDGERILLRMPKLASDISMDDSDFDEETDDSIEVSENNGNGVGCEGPALLVCDKTADGSSPWEEIVKEGGLAGLKQGTASLRFMRVADQCRCPNCNMKQNVRERMNDNGTFPIDRTTGMQSIFAPSKVLYNSLVKDVLLQDPVKDVVPERLPLKGRKLLSFTDSRQGAAYYAGSQGLRSESDATRTWLWRKINEEERLTSKQMISFVEERIEKFIKSHAVLPERFLGESNQNLAKLFLWREFTFRSRKKCSLETLGLVKVEYVVNGHNVLDLVDRPDALQALLSTVQFKNFIKILLDYGFRKRGALNCFNYQLVKDAFGSGISIKPFDLSKFSEAEKKPAVLDEIGKIARYYISNDVPKECSNAEWENLKLLIRETVNALRLLKFEDEDGDVDCLLIPAHDNKGNIVNDQYVINPECLSFVKNTEKVFVCPATKTLLDTAILGRDGKNYSPYIVSMSDVKHLPVEESVSLDEILAQKDLDSFNTALWWIDYHQNVMTTKSNEAFVVVKEDTAQIDSKKRVKDQQNFKKGKINILNCSTTMEMGVDIGGVSLVAHTNVPPHEYNYLQRAGRAGRAGQGQSFIWTLVGFGAHEHKAAENPLKWVTTNTLRQGLDFVSDVVQQRHINAYLLGSWIRNQNMDINFESSLKSFYLTEGSDNEWNVNVMNMINVDKIDEIEFTLLGCSKFKRLLEKHQIESAYNLFDKWLDSASIAHSLLMGRDHALLIDNAKKYFKKACIRWQEKVIDFYTLLNEASESDTVVPFKKLSRFQKSMRYHLKQMFNGFGLSFLIEQGVLPSNGMPVDVVEMEQPKSYEDNPSRERKIAIREFAPGTTIVRNGVRYTSKGICLNWKPYNGQGQAEPTVIAEYYTCPTCGTPWCSLYDDAKNGKKCSCGYDFEHEKKVFPRKIIEPVGFRADEGNLSLNELIKAPFEPAHIKFDKDFSLDESCGISIKYGRIHIFYLNGKTHANNDNQSVKEHNIVHSKDDSYHLCLKCGFVASSDEGFNSNQHKVFSKAYNMPCDENCWKDTHKVVSLAAIVESCGLAITLPQLNVKGNYKKASVAANTWGLVLRNALAEKLMVDYAELGWTVQMTTADAVKCFTIILYDNAVGGADLCFKAKDCLPELFLNARKMLECSDNCESVCLNCLLTKETQVMSNMLNRHFAYEMLDDAFFNTLKLPEELQYWGDRTILRNDFLHYCMDALESGETKEVRFYLPNIKDAYSPNIEDAEKESPLQRWPLINRLFGSRKCKLVIDQKIFDEIKQDIGAYDYALELCRICGSFECANELPAIKRKKVAVDVVRNDGSVEQVVMLMRPEDSYVESFFLNAAMKQCVCGVPQNYRDISRQRKSWNEVFAERNEYDSKHLDIKGSDKIQIKNFAKDIFNKMNIPVTGWVRMDYSDSFLHSPLAIRLFAEFVKLLNPQYIYATTKIDNRNVGPNEGCSWYKDYDKEKLNGIVRALIRQECPTSILNFIVRMVGKNASRQNTFTENSVYVKHDRFVILHSAEGKKIRIKFTGSFTQFKLADERVSYVVDPDVVDPDIDQEVKKIQELDGSEEIQLKDSDEEMTILYNEL